MDTKGHEFSVQHRDIWKKCRCGMSEFYFLSFQPHVSECKLKKKEEKISMKPFDLKAALEGKKVVRRDGKKVIRIIQIPELAPNNIMVLYKSNEQQTDVNWSWAFPDTGKQHASFQISDCDLFMATEKKEGWINIYSDSTRADDYKVFAFNNSTNRRTGTGIFNSKEAADKAAEIYALELKSQFRLGCVKIEWEE